MRAIDADALRAKFQETKEWRYSNKTVYPVYHLTSIWAEIDNAPTIEPERKKGKWEQVTISYLADADEDTKESMAIASMFCPVCKRYHNEVYMYGNPTSFANFCPNCGADMREGAEQDG